MKKPGLRLHALIYFCALAVSPALAQESVHPAAGTYKTYDQTLVEGLDDLCGYNAHVDAVEDSWIVRGTTWRDTGLAGDESSVIMRELYASSNDSTTYDVHNHVFRYAQWSPPSRRDVERSATLPRPMIFLAVDFQGVWEYSVVPPDTAFERYAFELDEFLRNQDRGKEAIDDFIVAAIGCGIILKYIPSDKIKDYFEMTDWAEIYR